MYIEVGLFSINPQICWPFSIIFCQYSFYIFENNLLLGKIIIVRALRVKFLIIIYIMVIVFFLQSFFEDFCFFSHSLITKSLCNALYNYELKSRIRSSLKSVNKNKSSLKCTKTVFV